MVCGKNVLNFLIGFKWWKCSSGHEAKTEWPSRENENAQGHFPGSAAPTSNSTINTLLLKQGN